MVGPEPWASFVDIITASQKLEDAIHAKSYEKIQSYLRKVDKYLKYAQDYFIEGSQIYPDLQEGYENLVNQVTSARGTLENLAKKVPKENFSQYQKTNLYDYQGVLGNLSKQISQTV